MSPENHIVGNKPYRKYVSKILNASTSIASVCLCVIYAALQRMEIESMTLLPDMEIELMTLLPHMPSKNIIKLELDIFELIYG